MDLSIHIRRADENDAAQVASVLNGVIAEDGLTVLDASISVEEERRFIAELGDRSLLHVADAGDHGILGVQSLSPISPVWTGSMHHVGTLGTWVAGGWRGIGVGQRLSAATFEFARSRGYQKLSIQVLASNQRALRFYRRLGFRRIGVAKRHVLLRGRYHDEVLLELQFGDSPGPASA
jgi:RimJ/RimL family protein N-acetyltransferase